MWVARFQLPELTKVPSGDGGERGTLCAGADIDALISEDHRAIAADQTEGVEDVGEVFRRELCYRSAFVLHSPRSEVADDSHRRRDAHGELSADGLRRRRNTYGEQRQKKQLTAGAHGSSPGKTLWFFRCDPDHMTRR